MRAGARGAWLLVLGFGALVSGCSGAGDGASAAPRQNILIIAADDLSSAALAAYDGRYAGLTPALDALAAESVVFRHAVASSPFCTPSRHSFLTGRWPHSIGATQVDSLLPAGVPTLGDTFRAGGYRTAAFGKMHWYRKSFPERDFGFDVLGDVHDWRAGFDAEERARYDAWHTLWSTREEGGWSQLNLEGIPLELDEERQYASWLVDRTLAFAQEADEPFLAFCSFNEPHAPFSFPPAFAQRVDPETLELPDDDPELLRSQAPGVYGIWKRALEQEGELSRADLARHVASYLRSVAWLDSQVGRLLAALDQAGLAEDTLVVFWSDHGYFLGEHGLWSKNQPFQEVVEAPLLVRDGRHTGQRTQPVQMLDVFPTLCELSGVEPPARLAGRSLAPLLASASDPGRGPAFSEFAGVWVRARTRDHSLVLGARPTLGFDQLYATRDDPGERTNRVADPALADVRGELFRAVEAFYRGTPPDWMPGELWMQGDTAGAQLRAAIAVTEPASTRRPRPGQATDD